MTHTLKVSEHSTLAHCPDCESDHIAPNPCGMSFRQRLSSVQLSGSVTETRTKRKYWDESSLKEFWGGKDEGERRDELMEETKGIGYVDKHEIHGEKGHALAKAIGISADDD